VTFTPADLVDHTQVIGTCFSCHDGTTATGKNPTHITSGNNCDDCHTTNAWIPANFDHTNITNNCISCHNGTDATGKHPTHINTTDICEDCHSKITWVPVTTVDHAQVLGSCSSCHDGNTATGKDPGHFVTNLECNECHTTNVWIPHIYQHMGLGYEPLDHAGNFACTRCHQGNSENVNWPAPAYIPDCAGCHFNDYATGEDDHRGINNDRNCADSGCHSISDGGW
jgi:hypothetical protein